VTKQFMLRRHVEVVQQYIFSGERRREKAEQRLSNQPGEYTLMLLTTEHSGEPRIRESYLVASPAVH
jgi:hypothetical protein